jgi:hypothetical protein
MKDAQFRELAYCAYKGAVNAYRDGSYRLALAGFGASLEAVLIDFLASLPPDDLATAVALADSDWNRFEDQADPSSFRIINLLRVAGRVPHITAPREVNEPVREWRNQIHPAVAIRDFRPEASLEPEARVSSGLVSALIRDIKEVL